MKTPAPSRRALLGGSVAAAVATSLPVSAAPPQDTLLIRMAAEIEHIDAERTRLMEPFYNQMFLQYPPETEDRLDVLSDSYNGVRRRLASQPATTLQGCQAKARALMVWLAPDGVEDSFADDDQRLVVSLCRDLLQI
jgi:hypothetical protein